jgi:hypothetical protein
MKTVKEWLHENNYDDVLRTIEAVERGWKRKGTGTRRDWWEVLAGNPNGNPKKIEGKTFPVLATARKRRGWPVTDGCLCRNSAEECPPVVPQARWSSSKGKGIS